MVKSRRDFLDYGTLKLGVSHKWFDELSKFVEWFLHADDDWIFDLMANLLCIFDIFWVFTAVVLVLFGFSAHRKSFRTWFSQIVLIKSWLSVKSLPPVQWNTQKNMGNEQKSRCSSCTVTESHNFKTLAFLLHGYHTSQFKNISIPDIAFSSHNSKIWPTLRMEFICIGNPT